MYSPLKAGLADIDAALELHQYLRDLQQAAVDLENVLFEARYQVSNELIEGAVANGPEHDHHDLFVGNDRMKAHRVVQPNYRLQMHASDVAEMTLNELLSQFGYLPSVHQWTDRELNPDFRHALDVTALPVCVLGRKWRVRGSHPAIQAYEARMSTGPPAVAGPGIEPGSSGL